MKIKVNAASDILNITNRLSSCSKSCERYANEYAKEMQKLEDEYTKLSNNLNQAEEYINIFDGLIKEINKLKKQLPDDILCSTYIDNSKETWSYQIGFASLTADPKEIYNILKKTLKSKYGKIILSKKYVTIESK